MSWARKPFLIANLCLSGFSFIPERTDVTCGMKAQGMIFSDRKRVLGLSGVGQTLRLKAQKVGWRALSREARVPGLQEHILEQDIMPPLLPCPLPVVPCGRGLSFPDPQRKPGGHLAVRSCVFLDIVSLVYFS